MSDFCFTEEEGKEKHSEWGWITQHLVSCTLLYRPLRNSQSVHTHFSPKANQSRAPLIYSKIFASSLRGAAETNPTRNREVAGSISGLAQ